MRIGCNNAATVLALEFTVLTAALIGKVTNIKRSEVNGNFCIVPAEQMDD